MRLTIHELIYLLQTLDMSVPADVFNTKTATPGQFKALAKLILYKNLNADVAGYIISQLPGGGLHACHTEQMLLGLGQPELATIISTTKIGCPKSYVNMTLARQILYFNARKSSDLVESTCYLAEQGYFDAAKVKDSGLQFLNKTQLMLVCDRCHFIYNKKDSVLQMRQHIIDGTHVNAATLGNFVRQPTSDVRIRKKKRSSDIESGEDESRVRFPDKEPDKVTRKRTRDQSPSATE